MDRGQRRRPVEEVAREVAAIPGRAVIFWDDHLTANRDYALELFEAIAPYHKWWTTQTTLQAAFDPELLAAAAESGCKAFFVGLESISQASLNSQGKGFNQVARYEQAVANLHRHGIAIQAGTMFGLDGDDPGIFERTLKYYREIGIDSATVSIVVPMPGTRLLRATGAGGAPPDEELGQVQREGRRRVPTEADVPPRAWSRVWPGSPISSTRCRRSTSDLSVSPGSGSGGTSPATSATAWRSTGATGWTSRTSPTSPRPPASLAPWPRPSRRSQPESE